MLVCMWVCTLWIKQNLPKAGKFLILSVKRVKEVTGSGLFTDLKLACAIHIEYFADLIF